MSDKIGEIGDLDLAGWQKLAAFRRGQKWPSNFRQTRIYYFRDKYIVFTPNCVIANLQIANCKFNSV